MVAWIRTKNHFPVYYFNHEGIIHEIQKVYKKNDILIQNGSLATQSSLGLLLLDFLFPNLHTVDAGYYDGQSVYNRFYNDEMLSKCLKGYISRYPLRSMRTAFFQLARLLWNTATNFAPMRAKAIYEYLAAPGATIYDYSCGFGGRMLGALCSRNNYHYIGCEPNTETYVHLQELGEYIGEALNTPSRYQIYNQCSEDLHLSPRSIDVAFSCPPFFGLERYSNEPTQSYNRFPQYSKWLEGYVRPTIQNIREALKDSGVMAVDIVDFNWRNQTYHLVTDWLRIAQEEGFILTEHMSIISRANARKPKNTPESKQEFVYILKK